MRGFVFRVVCMLCLLVGGVRQAVRDVGSFSAQVSITSDGQQIRTTYCKEDLDEEGLLLIEVRNNGSRRYQLGIALGDGAAHIPAPYFEQPAEKCKGGGSGASVAVFTLCNITDADNAEFAHLGDNIIVKNDGYEGVLEHKYLLQVETELEGMHDKVIRSHIPSFKGMYVSTKYLRLLEKYNKGVIVGPTKCEAGYFCMPQVGCTEKDCIGRLLDDVEDGIMSINSLDAATTGRKKYFIPKVNFQPLEAVAFMHALASGLHSDPGPKMQYTLHQSNLASDQHKIMQKAMEAFLYAHDHGDARLAFARKLKPAFRKHVEMLEHASTLRKFELPSKQMMEEVISILTTTTKFQEDAKPYFMQLDVFKKVDEFVGSAISKNIQRFTELRREWRSGELRSLFPKGKVAYASTGIALSWAMQFSELVSDALHFETGGLHNFGIKDGGLHNLFLETMPGQKGDDYEYDFLAFDLGEMNDVFRGAFAYKFLMSFFHFLGIDLQEPPLEARRIATTRSRLESIFQTYIEVRSHIANEFLGKKGKRDGSARLLDRYVIMQLFSDAVKPCLGNLAKYPEKRDEWIARGLFDITVAVALFLTFHDTPFHDTSIRAVRPISQDKLYDIKTLQPRFSWALDVLDVRPPADKPAPATTKQGTTISRSNSRKSVTRSASHDLSQ